MVTFYDLLLFFNQAQKGGAFLLIADGDGHIGRQRETQLLRVRERRVADYGAIRFQFSKTSF